MTKFAPHNAPVLIMRCKFTFDAKDVVHRVAGRARFINFWITHLHPALREKEEGKKQKKKEKNEVEKEGEKEEKKKKSIF